MKLLIHVKFRSQAQLHILKRELCEDALNLYGLSILNVEQSEESLKEEKQKFCRASALLQ